MTGELSVLPFNGGAIGAEAFGSLRQRAILTIDASSVIPGTLGTLALPGGTLAFSPSTTNPQVPVLVTMSLSASAGREWRVFQIGNIRLTRVQMDDPRYWALMIIDAGDAAVSDYRNYSVDGGVLTLVETGRLGYRALLTLSKDSSTPANVRAFNLPGGVVSRQEMATAGFFAFLLSSGGPVNTIAPAISSTSVIGTQISGADGTWTNPGTFTYQWQRNGSNIGGATSKNYTPVDADFGYALRLVVTSGGSSSANSNATNLTREAPVQSLGSELLLNPNFTNWTTDNPDNWAVSGEVASDPMVHQVAPGGGAGLGVAQLFASSQSFAPDVHQSILTQYSVYEFVTVVDYYTSGILGAGNNTVNFDTYTSTGAKRIPARTLDVSPVFYLSNANGVAAPINLGIDSASVKLITLNGALVAPSADMRITQFYTLPGTPVQGESLWLMPRISDYANGNYWLAFLMYAGSQWNITLYSVAAHVRTNRASATNIGSTNGIRVNMNGSSITLETTANAGGAWTQRGSTVTNSTFSTATGVNMLAASTLTLGNMVYEAAV